MAYSPAGRGLKSAMSRERILIVDDEPAIRVMLAEALSDCGYNCETASDGQEAFEKVAQGRFDLVLSDIRMPRADGRTLLRNLKQKYPDLPVVILSAVDDAESAIEMLTGGAEHYILKPIQLLELNIALERALEKGRLIRENRTYQQDLEKKVEERTAQLQQTLGHLEGVFQSTLEALVTALDAREHETQNHSQRVARYTVFLAEQIGVPHHGIKELYPGALLHDIGKIGISDTILLKKGKLTAEEWVIMKKHTEIGARIVARIGLAGVARNVVLHHHERFEGTGYPSGLKGEEIPVAARIFPLADTLDSITSDRPYRKAKSFAEARDEIVRCRGMQFDPALVDVFLSVPASHFMKIREEVAARVPPIEVYGQRAASPAADAEEEPAVSHGPKKK